MKNALRFVMALAAAMLLMLAFRALAITIYTVPRQGIWPWLQGGDRVVVNRWSYGLRTGGHLFRYARWLESPVGKGDLIAFNYPLDTLHRISARPVCAAYCRALPGDTVSIGGRPIIVPGKNRMIKVETWNMKLLCNMYRIHERRHAEIRGGGLYVDGRLTHCASFSRNYYWVTAIDRHNQNDSRYFGFLPESHIIGRVALLAYSRKPGMPFFHSFRGDRYCVPVGRVAFPSDGK